MSQDSRRENNLEEEKVESKGSQHYWQRCWQGFLAQSPRGTLISQASVTW